MVGERLWNDSNMGPALLYAAVLTGIASSGIALVDLFDLFWIGRVGVPIPIFFAGQAALFVGLAVEYRHDHGDESPVSRCR